MLDALVSAQLVLAVILLKIQYSVMSVIYVMYTKYFWSTEYLVLPGELRETLTGEVRFQQHSNECVGMLQIDKAVVRVGVGIRGRGNYKYENNFFSEYNRNFGKEFSGYYRRKEGNGKDAVGRICIPPLQPPPNAYIPGTCEYVTLHGKGN